jgi:hypothetical protein
MINVRHYITSTASNDMPYVLALLIDQEVRPDVSLNLPVVDWWTMEVPEATVPRI